MTVPALLQKHAPHLIASKSRMASSWLETSPNAIAVARANYDGGMVEMCQGSDKDAFYLYAIPRRAPIKREEHHKFFHAEELMA